MILFIDDEPRYVDAYKLELVDVGQQVALVSDVDEAIAFLAEHAAEVELVVLDIMMPARRTFRDVDTEKGRRTGIRLYARLREAHPNLPFIILTNVSDPEIVTHFEHEPKTQVLHKYECLPHEVAETAIGMIHRSAQTRDEP